MASGREVERRELELRLAVSVDVDVAVNDDPVGLAFVQVDAVDLGVEAVVVGPKGAKDLPNGGEALVVSQRLLGRNPRRNRDRKHDVAVFLALGLAHDPTDRLHDLRPGTCGAP